MMLLSLLTLRLMHFQHVTDGQVVYSTERDKSA